MSLQPDGILLVNVVSVHDFEDGQYLNTVWTTIQSEFSQTALISMREGQRTGNFILLAGNGDVHLRDLIKKSQWAPLLVQPELPKPNFILTDDFAPVESIAGALSSSN